MRIRVPGDKSLTQRALIFASLADGESRLSGLLHGGDSESTAGALRALGVGIPPIPDDGSAIVVRGVGLRGLTAPSDPLDLGNSGTGTRLLAGVLAGSGMTATIDGDASLRTRPMGRVVDPLTAMGAGFEYLADADRLPLKIVGRHPLEPIDWPSAVASAQVKSAVLLAGLTGGAFAMVTEPRRSRDHTERLLKQVGVSVISHAVGERWRVEMRDPPQRIEALDFEVPGDVSSASFVFALAALGGAGPEVTVQRVGLNPTRTVFLDVLRRMGADVDIDETTPEGSAEPHGDVTVRPSTLVGVEVGEAEVPGLIDELPLLAALGARAEGRTRITGAAELRNKESDRIRAMVTNFRALGIETEELADGLVVAGSDRPLSGWVKAWDDHRIVMAFGVLDALPGNEIQVDHPTAADVSFPGFREMMHTLSARR